jgi:hypothetical protein
METPHKLIAVLRRDGHSIRAIAQRVGLSKSRVHEIVTAQTNGVVEDDLDDGAEDPWSDEDWHDDNAGGEWDPMDDLPPRPWTYHGTERVELDMGRGEQPKLSRVEVWTDANGERVNFELEAYRLRTYLGVRGNHDDASSEAVRSFDADCQRQRDEYAARAGRAN